MSIEKIFPILLAAFLFMGFTSPSPEKLPNLKISSFFKKVIKSHSRIRIVRLKNVHQNTLTRQIQEWLYYEKALRSA